MVSALDVKQWGRNAQQRRLRSVGAERPKGKEEKETLRREKKKQTGSRWRKKIFSVRSILEANLYITYFQD